MNLRSFLKQNGVRCLLWGAVMTATVSVAAWLMLSNLYRFLAFDPQFYDIFAQIADAPMAVPVVLLLILSVVYCLEAAALRAKGNGGSVAAVLLGVVVWLLLLAVAILLTDVNRIRFGDVLFSLIHLLQSGVL